MPLLECDPTKYIVWVDHSVEGWTMSDELDDLVAVLDYITGDMVMGQRFIITQPVPMKLVPVSNIGGFPGA